MKNAQEIFGKSLNLVQHPHCRKGERTCAWQIDPNKYLSMSRATVEGLCQVQGKELGAAIQITGPCGWRGYGSSSVAALAAGWGA